MDVELHKRTWLTLKPPFGEGVANGSRAIGDKGDSTHGHFASHADQTLEGRNNKFVAWFIKPGKTTARFDRQAMKTGTQVFPPSYPAK
jgi:hypothetical protein